MTIWIKLDVQGDLQPIVCKARGEVERYYDLDNHDLFITSQREGIHSSGSLHPEGWAFDCRKFSGFDNEDLKSIKELLGSDFDVVSESDHLHIEYDPKIVHK